MMQRQSNSDSVVSLTQSDLLIPVESFATGWQTAVTRPPKVRVESLSCDLPDAKVVSVRAAAPKTHVFSYTFPESPVWEPPSENRGKSNHKPRTKSRPKSTERTTRIKPPGDIIKVKDRLYYVLQPTLESLLHSASLCFPFEPFPYQMQGIAFLYPRYAAVLADEMGLGKTMQAISTIRLLLYAREVQRVLLICPKPLVTNWRREFALWAPEIPLGIIEGDKQTRHWQWHHPNAIVKIANYELLMRDQDSFDDQLHFDLVVLDEAQRIKNRNSTTSQIARSISRTRSWALTGTPIENSTEDLVGIFEFLSPGFLHSGMSARHLGKATSDHVLRRTKDKVMTDLPPKMFRDADLALSPEQLATYKTAEEDGIVQLTDMGESLTVQHVFELVLRLKQICNFDPVTGVSSKLERLVADLEEIASSGKKAIVFSQWVSTLEQIRDKIQPFCPLEYHGKIPTKKRDAVIDRFRNDPDNRVILMSYGAGSVGLNLQFCEYVFLFDRWWNPAVEDQAINRAHRIGAVGAVTVTRMLAVETIEERINQVLEEKRQLFDSIFSHAGAPKKAGLTQAEIFGLFKLRTPQGPIENAA